MPTANKCTTRHYTSPNHTPLKGQYNDIPGMNIELFIPENTYVLNIASEVLYIECNQNIADTD